MIGLPTSTCWYTACSSTEKIKELDWAQNDFSIWWKKDFLKGHWPVSLVQAVSHLAQLCCRISRIPRFTDFPETQTPPPPRIHWTSARDLFLWHPTTPLGIPYPPHIPPYSFLPLVRVLQPGVNSWQSNSINEKKKFTKWMVQADNIILISRILMLPGSIRQQFSNR